MAKNTTKSSFDPDLLDRLLAGREPKSVLEADGLVGELKKALAERMLNAELSSHLDSETEQAAGNHRNGTSPKTVLTEDGAVTLSIPRDRHGRFEPALIAKYRRRFPGFDEKIIARLSPRDEYARHPGPCRRALWGNDLTGARLGGDRRGHRG